eukprot:2007931-Lingulodinium_polyedra.AAC.1
MQDARPHIVGFLGADMECQVDPVGRHRGRLDEDEVQYLIGGPLPAPLVWSEAEPLAGGRPARGLLGRRLLLGLPVAVQQMSSHCLRYANLLPAGTGSTPQSSDAVQDVFLGAASRS